MTAVLAARGLCAGYGAVTVVRDLNLEVAPGEVLAILGPNGAGKTTTLRTLAGSLPPLAGHVEIHGSGTRAPLHRRSREGLGFVTEERSVFSTLTTRQNLLVGRGCDPAKTVRMFPELEPLLGRRAGLLSGGEQQMVTLGRALARPLKVLLADELSLGLAHKVVDRLLQAVREAADAGLAVVLVEQHVSRVLKIADRAIVLRQGKVEIEGTAADVRERLSDIEELYLARDTAST
jgi:branched-chain amino acid transport system ATP-binding protein